MKTSEKGVEIWKDIHGYEGKYQVSNFGRVRSLDRLSWTGKAFVRVKGRIMTQNRRYNKKRNEYGYPYVSFHNSSHSPSKKMLVHRLVAEAFLPNPNDLPCINHKDEDKANNSLSNLEWCDIAYNNAYGTARKRSMETRRRKGICKKVLKFDMDFNLLKTFSSVAEAAKEISVGKTVISEICLGWKRGKYRTYRKKFIYQFA